MALDPQVDGETSDDLRASLSAQFDAIEPPAETVVSDPVADTPIADAPAETVPVETRADHPSDPARYADGTFKPKPGEAPVAAAPADTKTVSPSKDDQTKASAPASNQADAPPAGWTAAEKAEWSKLPPAVQAAVSRREAEMTRGGQQWSDQKRQYEQVLSPLVQETQRLGVSPQQGLQQLLAAHRALNENPANAIAHLARQYNVDLATLAGQSTADGSREQSQPDISALVRQAVGPILAPLQERFAAEDRRQQENTVNLVTDFARAPGHEHFDAVENELMALIPQIKAANPTWPHDKILQDAYDRAVYANPATRQATLAARDAAAEEKRRTDAAARATKARTAGSSVTGSPASGGAAPKQHDSIRDELMAAMAGSA